MFGQNQYGDLSLEVKLKGHQSGNYNRIQLKFYDDISSIYYGLGEQHSYLSLGKNRPFTTLVREKGVGRGSQPTTFLVDLSHEAGGSYYHSYSPAPIWIDYRKVGYFINSFAYCSWINNRVRVWDNSVQLYIISRPSLKEVVSQISRYNGYTPPVPSWVNSGAIVGLQGGTKTVLNQYNKLKSFGAKISGLWLQDWSSKRKCKTGGSRLWWNWELDHQHYENWDGMREELKKDNVELAVYFNPQFTELSTKKSYRRNFFKEGHQKDIFLKQKTNKTFYTSSIGDFVSAMMNFSNPQGVKFYQDVLGKGFNETGSRGAMIDFGQAYPVQNMPGTLQQALKAHNRYPTEYHKHVHQFINNHYGKNHNFYTFIRASYLYTPKYAFSLWTGDQAMNFDFHNGLPSCVTAMLSSGLIGFSSAHCDVGGYIYGKLLGFSLAVRSQNLMIKWMQLGAFSPVFRTHQGNNPQALQVYSNPILSKNFALYTTIFSLLNPYRSQQTALSQQQGLPLVRALFLQHEDIRIVAQIQDQFYLGEDIIVSPHVDEKMERDYYLPQGKWIDIWNQMQVEGCGCWRRSTGVLPPVFIKAASKYAIQIPQKIHKLIIETQKLWTETTKTTTSQVPQDL